MRTLKERLQWALSQKPGATQADLARACKVRAPSVAGWFSGRTKTLKAHSLRAASAYLGVNMDWLSDGVGSPYDADTLNEPPTSYGGVAMERGNHTVYDAVLVIADAIEHATPAARVAIPSLLERLGQCPSEAESIASIMLTLLSAAQQQDARR